VDYFEYGQTNRNQQNFTCLGWHTHLWFSETGHFRGL